MATTPAMTRGRRLAREGAIMAFALVVMTLKITLGVMLIHRWKERAARDHAPFGDAEDDQ
jgi:hypothetical protein